MERGGCCRGRARRVAGRGVGGFGERGRRRGPPRVADCARGRAARRRYTPDLDLVSLARPGGAGDGAGPEGFLVCRVGPRVAGVQEGDVITAVDGLPVALDLAAAAWLAAESARRRAEDAAGAAPAEEEEDEDGAGGPLVCREALLASPLGQLLGAEAAGALFDRADPERAGLAELAELRAKADAELAQRLFGAYKSAARLSLLRPEPGPGGPGAYREVPGGAECARTRDARERAAPQTPDRFKRFLMWRAGPDARSAWTEVGPARIHAPAQTACTHAHAHARTRARAHARARRCGRRARWGFGWTGSRRSSGPGGASSSAPAPRAPRGSCATCSTAGGARASSSAWTATPPPPPAAAEARRRRRTGSWRAGGSEAAARARWAPKGRSAPCREPRLLLLPRGAGLRYPGRPPAIPHQSTPYSTLPDSTPNSAAMGGQLPYGLGARVWDSGDRGEGVAVCGGGGGPAASPTHPRWRRRLFGINFNTLVRSSQSLGRPGRPAALPTATGWDEELQAETRLRHHKLRRRLRKATGAE